MQISPVSHNTAFARNPHQNKRLEVCLLHWYFIDPGTECVRVLTTQVRNFLKTGNFIKSVYSIDKNIFITRLVAAVRSTSQERHVLSQ